MIELPAPDAQVSFARLLRQFRDRCLQGVVTNVVAKLEIPALDRQLAEYVPASALAALAGHGLRAELVFPTPLVLIARPELLTYYRLLHGFSQKEFYRAGSDVSRFKAMEVSNVLTGKAAPHVPDLCRAFAVVGCDLLAGLGDQALDSRFLDDLSLLTLGPQLRGGANVKAGAAGISAVFEAIHSIVKGAVVKADPSRIELLNGAGRRVVIEFASDPDIVIQEQIADAHVRQAVAIEVKAGRDFSNIHNRIGEAEKSHLKARGRGFVECWTVVNVDKIDMLQARRESPSTDHFFRISDLSLGCGPAYEEFRNRVIGLTGIVAP